MHLSAVEALVTRRLVGAEVVVLLGVGSGVVGVACMLLPRLPSGPNSPPTAGDGTWTLPSDAGPSAVTRSCSLCPQVFCP